MAYYGVYDRTSFGSSKICKTMEYEQEHSWIWFVEHERIRLCNLEDKFLRAEKQTHQYIWLPINRERRAQDILSWHWEGKRREQNLKKKKENICLNYDTAAPHVNFCSLTATSSSEPWRNL